MWASGILGYVWNRLELVAVTAADSDEDLSGYDVTEADGSEPYWRPSDQSTWFGAISIGLKYSLSP